MLISSFMILEQIQSDLKEALKAHDETKVSALRFLLAQIHNREIDLHGQGKDLTDEEVVAVLQKQAKERKESIEAFKQNGRDELVKKEEDELSILNNYLPQQLAPKEVEKIVAETLIEIGATGPADFGKAMKAVMEKVKGEADGTQVKEMVKSCLAK